MIVPAKGGWFEHVFYHLPIMGKSTYHPLRRSSSGLNDPARSITLENPIAFAVSASIWISFSMTNGSFSGFTSSGTEKKSRNCVLPILSRIIGGCAVRSAPPRTITRTPCTRQPRPSPLHALRGTPISPITSIRISSGSSMGVVNRTGLPDAMVVAPIDVRSNMVLMISFMTYMFNDLKCKTKRRSAMKRKVILPRVEKHLSLLHLTASIKHNKH